MKFDMCIIFLVNTHFLASPVSCSNNGARADEQPQIGRLVNHVISSFILYSLMRERLVVLFEVYLSTLIRSNMLRYKFWIFHRQLERKFSEQNIGAPAPAPAPPSYEEAVSESGSTVHSRRCKFCSKVMIVNRHLFFFILFSSHSTEILYL